MKVLDKGHIYSLNNRGAYPGIAPSKPVQTIHFVNREPGRESEGTTTQEVIRSLIDRTRYCNDCLPSELNKKIVQHLRMALVLHEVRAIMVKVENDEIEPEFFVLGDDGHMRLVFDDSMRSEYTRVWPDRGTDTGSLKPGECSHKKLDATPEYGWNEPLPDALTKGIQGVTATPKHPEKVA